MKSLNHSKGERPAIEKAVEKWRIIKVVKE
jgi:hypothetical protein